jgi:quercetin dioxygenase-like cupin family protein
VQVNVYILEPGGRIPAHKHSASWDICFVIEGEIEARFSEGGTLCANDDETLTPLRV